MYPKTVFPKSQRCSNFHVLFSRKPTCLFPKPDLLKKWGNIPDVSGRIPNGWQHCNYIIPACSWLHDYGRMGGKLCHYSYNITARQAACQSMQFILCIDCSIDWHAACPNVFVIDGSPNGCTNTVQMEIDNHLKEDVGRGSYQDKFILMGIQNHYHIQDGAFAFASAQTTTFTLPIGISKYYPTLKTLSLLYPMW